jgi:2-octaprenyl-6-methoxyphenol hydroxylase
MTDPRPVIVGAGPVGAVCALACAQAGIAVEVLEARPAGDPGNDRRTLALSHGSRQILERLGVWDQLASPTAITTIHISHKGGFGRALLRAWEHGLPALGYVLAYGELDRVLQTALQTASVAVRHGCAVTAVEGGETRATLHMADASQTAPLVIVADGGRGADAPRERRDYRQHALVCEVVSARPHGGVAYERFTPDGPVALLPRGDRYALVWVAAPEHVAALRALPDGVFLEALGRHFGARVGRFLACGPRNAFPLTLALATARAARRVVKIGNAAQTLHPVAGQGFNLGLRDAWALAEHLADTPASDWGAAAWLADYARQRRADQWLGAGFTDALVQVFSNDHPLLRHVRGMGLAMLDALPPLRRQLTRAMLYGVRG